MTQPSEASGTRRTRRPTMRRVRWGDDLDVVRRLFEEYRGWIADHRDTAHASQPRVSAGLALVDRLIENLPQEYGPPRGDVLLWFQGEEVVACGALRTLAPRVAEIRRVHVRADFRGGRFGPPFVLALIARARELGFDRVRADCLPSMQGAIEFYTELGFRPTSAYWPHPAEGALFFEQEVISPEGPPTAHDANRR